MDEPYKPRLSPKYGYPPSDTPLKVYYDMKDFLCGIHDHIGASHVLENIWRPTLFFYFPLGEGFAVHERHYAIDNKRTFEFNVSTKVNSNNFFKSFFFVRTSTEEPVYDVLVQKQIEQIETLREMLPMPTVHYVPDEVYGVITGGRTMWFCTYRRVIQKDGSEKWEAEQMPAPFLKDPLAPIQLGENYSDVYAAMVDIKKRGVEAICANPKLLTVENI